MKTALFSIKMVPAVGLEPTTSSAGSRLNIDNMPAYMVLVIGLEPMTLSLSGMYSNQLNYTSIISSKLYLKLHIYHFGDNLNNIVFIL